MVGPSEWSHDHWDGVLYGPTRPPARRLERYVQELDTVKPNASLYRWPREQTFRGWRRRLCTGLRMSVKVPRALSHGPTASASGSGTVTVSAYVNTDGHGHAVTNAPDYALWSAAALELMRSRWASASSTIRRRLSSSSVST